MLTGCINSSHVKERNIQISCLNQNLTKFMFVILNQNFSKDKLLVFCAVMRVEPWIEDEASREVTGILFRNFSVA